MGWYQRTSSGWQALSIARPLTRDHVRARAIFDPDTWWYEPLPDNAPLDPNSTVQVANIAAKYGGSVNLDRSHYTPQVVLARNTDPLVTFTWDNRTGAGSSLNLLTEHLNNVRIPATAEPAAGTDNEVIVYNVDTGQYTDIWGATKLSATSWMAAWAGTIPNARTSDGVHAVPYGAAASGLAFLPGMITADEAADGHIPHTIGIGLPLELIDARVSIPATRTDGDAPQVANTVCQGQRLRLPASLDIASLGLSRMGRIVARCAQEYGLIIWDRGTTSTTVRCQNGTGMTRDPWPALTGGAPDPLAGFPVAQLQVIEKDWMPA